MKCYCTTTLLENDAVVDKRLKDAMLISMAHNISRNYMLHIELAAHTGQTHSEQ